MAQDQADPDQADHLLELAVHSDPELAVHSDPELAVHSDRDLDLVDHSARVTEVSEVLIVNLRPFQARPLRRPRLLPNENSRVIERE
jgi:hypothetical protein